MNIVYCFKYNLTNFALISFVSIASKCCYLTHSQQLLILKYELIQTKLNSFFVLIQASLQVSAKFAGCFI